MKNQDMTTVVTKLPPTLLKLVLTRHCPPCLQRRLRKQGEKRKTQRTSSHKLPPPPPFASTPNIPEPQSLTLPLRQTALLAPPPPVFPLPSQLATKSRPCFRPIWARPSRSGLDMGTSTCACIIPVLLLIVQSSGATILARI